MEPTGGLNHGGWEPVQFEENSRHWDLREAKKPWPSRRLISVRLTTPPCFIVVTRSTAIVVIAKAESLERHTVEAKTTDNEHLRINALNT